LYQISVDSNIPCCVKVIGQWYDEQLATEFSFLFTVIIFLMLHTTHHQHIWFMCVCLCVCLSGQSSLDFFYYFVEERKGVHGSNIKEGRILAG